MISKKTKAAIKEATTVKPNEESQSTPSDAQIVYAPLLKYGAIAIGIVAVIVTTAIMNERQTQGFNGKTTHTVIANIETDAEIIDSQSSEVIATAPVAQDKNENEVSVIESTESMIAVIEEAEINVISAEEQTITKELSTSSIEPTPTITPIVTTEASLIRTQSKNAVIMAQHRDTMLKQDQRQLEFMKANHERHINTLRRQFGQQNSYMEQNIKRLESNYLKQVAAIKKGQDFRKLMTSRI